MTSTLPAPQQTRLDRVRETPRAPYRREIRLFEAHANEPLRLLSRDIAEGGVFVYAQLCFDPGALVRVEVPVPACASVVTRARVVRVELRRDAPDESGMALEFVGLGEVQRQRFAALVNAALRPAQTASRTESHDPLPLVPHL